MEQRQAGRSGLALSVLGLSTRSWGGAMDADAAAAALGAFRNAGGTFVDTTAAAPDAHRDAVGHGESVLGALLTGDRDAMVLAAAPLSGVGELPSSRTAVLRGLTDCLRRLRCDHIDLWQVPPTATGGTLGPGACAAPAVPLEETLSAMDAAVASGKVRYIGLCEPVAWRLARAAARQHAWPGRAPVVSDQVAYSLLDRRVEPDLVDAADELGVGLICAAAGPGPGADADGRTARLIEAVATAADGLATSALTMSLSWLRERPGVTSMVVDARTPAHLGAALSSLELSIPDPIRRVLDEVSEPSRRIGPS